MQPNEKHLLGCPAYVKPENRSKPFDYDSNGLYKNDVYKNFMDTVFGKK